MSNAPQSIDPKLVSDEKLKLCSAIKQKLPKIIKQFTNQNEYRFIAKVLPIYYDEQLPKMAKQNLDETSAPACCYHSEYVAFSSENMAQLLIEAIQMKASNGFPDDIEAQQKYLSTEAYKLQNAYANLYWEVSTILAHEFTHVICEHSKLRLLHAAKHKDVRTYILAEEIQANRGYGIEKDTFAYSVGVSEDTFPETKNCYTLETIYKALRDANGEQYEQQMKQMEQTSQQQMESPAGTSEQKQQQAMQRLTKQHNTKQLSETPQTSSDDGQQTLAQKLQQRYGLSPEELPVANTPGGKYGGGAEGKLASSTSGQILSDINKKLVQAMIKKSLAKMRATIKGNIVKSKIKTYARPSRRAPQSVAPQSPQSVAPQSPQSVAPQSPQSVAPNEQYSGGLLTKGVKKAPRFEPKVLVALDKSGSMDSNKIADVANTIDAIVKQLGRSTKGCYISMHDRKTYEAVPLRNYKKILDKYDASGGNDFSKVYLQAAKLGVDVVLNVGDGLDGITEDVSRLERVDNAKKLLNGRKLEWFDVIIPKIQGFYEGDFYERTLKRDAENGVTRKPLSLAGDYSDE